MAASFNDVTRGKALPESRRDNRRSQKRQSHLAAMRVPGNRERDAVWNDRETRPGYASSGRPARHRP